MENSTVGVAAKTKIRLRPADPASEGIGAIINRRNRLVPRAV